MDSERHGSARSSASERQLPFPSNDVDGSTPAPQGRTNGVHRLMTELPGPPVELTRGEALLPASFGQQRLWFVAQMFPAAPTYNEPHLVQIAGPVDASVLARSLTEITRRHEAWRTVFVTVDGQPFQQIQPPRPFPLTVIDLTFLPPEQREAEALRLAVNDAHRPFDLQTGPLVRALLLQLSDADARLSVTTHHIINDGISFFNVFVPELRALYVAFSRGQPSPLPALPVQYADYAAWQRRWLTEDVLAPKLSYWRAHLSGLTELRLPTDYPRPNEPSAEGAQVPVALPAELMERLRELSRRAGVSLFTTVLSAWKTLLFRYTGQRDIVVGTAAAGRPRPEFDQLIGFFMNTLVLRTQLEGDWTFLSLLSRVGEVLKAAREHQDVPFDRLITELKVERSPEKSPIFNTAFIMLPFLVPRDPPHWSEGRFDVGTAKVDLYLELYQRPSGLVGHVEYKTALFSRATIERMIGHLRTLLEAVVRDPEQRLAELPLLTLAEKRQLVVWNDTAAPYPADQCIHHLFEAQVDKTPDAIAVECEDARLTYAELNGQSNQLAHHLRALGVGPEVRVGLCVERSLEMVVGLLAILKAGGAYVPLDPSYPSERLAFMLADASVPVLLTQARLADMLPAHAARVLRLDADASQWATRPDIPPSSGVCPDNVVYVIYTSGSTGRPKGVMVHHLGLINYLIWSMRTYAVAEGQGVPVQSSIAFDLTVLSVFAPLAVGQRLLLLPDGSGVDALGSALRKGSDLSLVNITPAHLDALIQDPSVASSLRKVRTFILGAEALSAASVAALRTHAPDARVFHDYGPTETVIACSVTEIPSTFTGAGTVPIGRPIPNMRLHVLDPYLEPVAIGITGELYIGGVSVARGYLHRPDLTAERFVPDPFSGEPGARLYKTGDLARVRADGSHEFLGRIDHQVKIRGYRIELGEIEFELEHHPDVQMAAVEAKDITGDKRLVGYVVPRAGAPEGLHGALKKHLRARLPEYMVPPTFVTLERMPVTPNGKIDRVRLPSPCPPERRTAPVSSSVEQAVADIWRQVLGVAEVSADAPFFEIGGHSLLLVRVQAALSARLGVDIDLVTLMRLPTIQGLTAHLEAMPMLKGTANADPRPTLKGTANADPRPTLKGTANADPRPTLMRAAAPAERAEPVVTAAPSPKRSEAIAIVGMAIRAPGVRSPEQLWEVVRAGRETIRVLDPEALIAAGADPNRVRHPAFVPVEGVLEDTDRFDGAFFGYTDADAALMDPQQRLFLECAYEALEHAGCDPARFPGQIGVFGGAGASLHWLGGVQEKLRAARSDQEHYRANTLNAPDFLATRVAFKLGLRGPAVTVQTACSTSLSAVHVALQSLLAGECDMALAGGVSITSLREADWGYLRAEGGIHSADGHCRPFDADASGIVGASGVAIVALKPLSSALSDGDTIYAVVLGSAMNNDGARKMGFTAPSEDGLAAAIQRAYEVAGVDPGSVQFIEAHGTGTRLGDPTEVRALTRAYRRWTEQRGFCALGSVKANLGHMDAAAGAAGLIKAALALSHGIIPRLPGFRAPNPLLELALSPFFVNDTPLPWPRTETPRRAGVTSMGIGGTNIHVVLEEAPSAEKPASKRRPFELLCLSAGTALALVKVAQRLGAHLEDHPSVDLADVAYTLAVGRAAHRFRATMVCQGAAEARRALAPGATPSLATASPTVKAARPVVFLFPGHGVQYLKMGLDAYEAEPVYRAEIDRCLDLLRDETDTDLRPLLFDQTPEGERRLDEMRWAQPLLFTIEYALAKLFMAWGVRPAAMLGHSVGEYVAACIGGVLSLKDALALVVARGSLMDTTPPGGMLTVFADPRTIEPSLGEGVVIATYAPDCAVLSGPEGAIAEARARFTHAGIETSGLRVSRASHSPLMHAIRDAFRQRVAEVELQPPVLPIVSNVTGRYLTAEQATSPDYWAEHLCSAVRLADGLGTLFDLELPVCIELGPGSTLGSFLKRHPQFAGGKVDVVGTLPSLRKREEPSSAALLLGLGRAWELGVEVDWQAFHAHEQRRRIPLPTYPFEGKRYALGAPLSEERPALDARALAIASELGVRSIDDYPGLRPRLEALCASLVLDFFARRLGDEGRRARSLEALRQSAGILPQFSPMFEELVKLLVSMGLASLTSTAELLLRAEQVGRSAELSGRLMQEYPAFRGLVRFIEHCVVHYDEALTGAAEPVSVLYPDGTDALFRSFMRETAPFLYSDVYLAMACEAVLDLVRRCEGRRLRILEVGAGHGTLTWRLVERLRGADVEYHFTDIGRSFLQRAEAEAERRGIAWMKMSRFDLNRPPEDQGMVDRYDVILGFNAVHVALDLPAALARLHDMLVPSGALILVELTRMETWDKLIWGLAPGYWEITRAHGALSMDLARWEELLWRARFGHVTSAPRDARRREVEEHGLLIAERTLADEQPRSIAAARPAPNAALNLSPLAKEVHDRESAPDDAREVVRSLWKRLLGVSHVSTETSFFDLGGDSLLAVQFLAELRVRTGCDIKIGQFTAQPTVNGIAGLVVAKPPLAALAAPERAAQVPVDVPGVEAAFVASGAENCLVPLRAAGTKRPFFCVHPIGGGALCYAPLARAMDPQRPFFGIQSPMLEDRSVRPGSVEEMAARYVDALQRAQPEGPYLLGGWSFGGVVAAEMARQLKHRGQVVAKLVLLDVAATPSGGMKLLRRVHERLPTLAMLPAIFAESSSGAKNRGRAPSDDIARLADMFTTAGQHLVVYDHHLALWRRHAPAELDVPTVHFVAERRPLLGATLCSFGSSRLPIHAVHAEQVPGDHFSMLSGDHVGGLAARIEAVLDAAEPRQRAKDADSGESSNEHDEASVRAFLQQIVDQMQKQDATSLVERLWAKSPACVLVGVSGGMIAGAGPIKEHYTRATAALQDARIRLRGERVLVLAGRQAAFATAQLDSDLTYVEHDRRRSYRDVRVSWVLEKQSGTWRVVHAHYSLPVGESVQANA
jgi:amino acid adenylation domain-containing protein